MVAGPNINPRITVAIATIPKQDVSTDAIATIPKQDVSTEMFFWRFCISFYLCIYVLVLFQTQMSFSSLLAFFRNG